MLINDNKREPGEPDQKYGKGKRMKNIELLQATGIKNICIVSYQLDEDERVQEMKAVLGKNGFRVRMAGNMGGLMHRFIRYKLSERITKSQKIKRWIKFLLLSMERKMQGGKKADGRNSLYLLIDQPKNGEGWVHEEAQILLEERHLSDHIFFYDKKSDRIMRFEKPVLGYLEFDVARHCNLKCKGCSHYSNLVKEPIWGDLGRFREHLARLRELFDHIEVFRLVGGEPFLNQNVGQFTAAVREFFPDAALTVVTNGLLIPHINGDILDAVRESKAAVQISNYPPTVKIAGKIKERLDQSKIRYYFSKPIQYFQYEVGETPGNGTRNHRHCPFIHCHILNDDGKLCLCDPPLLYQKSREYLKVEREISEECWTDIAQVKDGYELLKKLHRQIPFCRYCLTRKKIMFPWQGGYTQELRDDEMGIHGRKKK